MAHFHVNQLLKTNIKWLLDNAAGSMVGGAYSALCELRMRLEMVGWDADTLSPADVYFLALLNLDAHQIGLR